MIYPIFLNPDFKDRIWGGSQLSTLFDKAIPNDHTGESWEVACHDNGNSTVSNGVYKGKLLKDIVLNDKEAWLGSAFTEVKKFPLLIKFIDAKEKLSVQVHPDDAYAAVNENGEFGKNECWYILDSKPGSELIVGLKKEISKEDFVQAVKDGKVEDTLNTIPVKAGDVINIPAGVLHAIGDGIVLAEVQQNSDTTYRVYDWNRVGLDGKKRDLHIEKSIDVIDFEGIHETTKTEGLSIKNEEFETLYYIANSYFALEKVKLHGTMLHDTEQKKFYIYLCIDGSGSLNYNQESYPIKKGDAVFIPASLGSYSIEGNGDFIKTYVPDNANEMIQPLVDAGYDEQTIRQKVRILF